MGVLAKRLWRGVVDFPSKMSEAKSERTLNTAILILSFGAGSSPSDLLDLSRIARTIVTVTSEAETLRDCGETLLRPVSTLEQTSAPGVNFARGLLGVSQGLVQ